MAVVKGEVLTIEQVWRFRFNRRFFYDKCKGNLKVISTSDGPLIYWSPDSYEKRENFFVIDIHDVKYIALTGKVMTLVMNNESIHLKFKGIGYGQFLNSLPVQLLEHDRSIEDSFLRKDRICTYFAQIEAKISTMLVILDSLNRPGGFDLSDVSVKSVQPLSSRTTGDQTPPGSRPSPTDQPVLVRNVSSQTTVSVEECYRMTSKPRGLALILDNEDFSQSSGCSNRPGTRVDAENLNTLFSGLGFKVTTQRNLTAEEMRGEIIEFAGKADDHAKADMCVVVILSHGSNGVIYGTDGIPVKIKWILQQFNNASCPQLQGKPKFFVFQCCRGDEEDYGTAKFIVSSTETDARGQNPQPKELTFEDMLIAYSTIPEYVSHRDTTKGTWYIQCLVKVFKERAGDTDIRRMLDLVAYRLKNCESEDGQRQSCSYEVIHLYNKLILGPEHAQ